MALALSQEPCPMRLPNYRSSYLLRYHPYPRLAPSRHEDFAMELGNLSDDDMLVHHVPPSQNSVGGRDVSSNLAYALHDASLVLDHQQSATRLSFLILDLAFVVQQKCKATVVIGKKA